MAVKRVYFFGGTQYVRFDVALDTVPAGYPRDTASVWTGLPGTIDAAFNLANGKIYFFSGANYYRWDALKDALDPGYPKTINGNWTGIGGTGFEAGPIDAAVNFGTGKAYWFKGDQYLRLDIATKAVDPGYPKAISGNWPGVAGTGFEKDVDAAINFGNDKVYWFKGDKYIRIDITSKSMDAGYPKPIAGNWSGIFATGIGAAVEWPTAIVAPGTFNVPTNRSGAVQQGVGGGRNFDGETFDMQVDFDSTPYSATPPLGEYRQYVRGRFTVNGSALTHLLADPAGGPPPTMLPTPAVGAAADNFRQDGIRVATWPGVAGPVDILYGHRVNAIDNANGNDIFQNPDRLTGTQYRGHDGPGITGVIGTPFSVQLDFRGQAIDVANGNDVLQSNDWSVNVSGTL